MFKTYLNSCRTLESLLSASYCLFSQPAFTDAIVMAEGMTKCHSKPTQASNPAQRLDLLVSQPMSELIFPIYANRTITECEVLDSNDWS